MGKSKCLKSMLARPKKERLKRNMFGLLTEHDHSIRAEDGKVTFHDKPRLYQEWDWGKKALRDLRVRGYVEINQLPQVITPEERHITRGNLSKKNLDVLDNIERNLIYDKTR